MRALHALEDLEPLFKIFYTFVCKKVPGKLQTNILVRSLKVRIVTELTKAPNFAQR